MTWGGVEQACPAAYGWCVGGASWCRCLWLPCSGGFGIGDSRLSLILGWLALGAMTGVLALGVLFDMAPGCLVLACFALPIYLDVNFNKLLYGALYI